MSKEFTIWLRLQQALPNLGRKLGTNPKMYHPAGLTRAQKYARKNAASGWRSIGVVPPEGAAALLYLRKQWGFKTNAQTATVAMLYLARHTRAGLQKIDLD